MRTVKTLGRASILVVLVCFAPCLAAEPAVIHVMGAATKPGDWTVARLKSECAADAKQIDYASRGQKHSSNAVPLLSVLRAAGVQTELKMDPKADPKTKNIPLRLAVIVQGRDGYTSVFSLAEILPDMGNREVWLAFDVDGADLPASDGPLKLIVPQDIKPGRWVRALASITIVDENPPATQP